MSLLNHIFHHVGFSKIDPLANGLAEEIAAEQSESEAIVLSEDIDAQLLDDEWRHILDEFHHDPDSMSLGQDE